MRIETTVRVADGELAVTVNPGSEKPFATIDFDQLSYLRIKTMDDCDRLICAAVTAKRRLEAAIAGTPHAFAAAAFHHHCDTCGMLRGEKIHVSPEATALDASIITGTPVIVTDDEDPRCKCGHRQTLHDEDGSHECHAAACGCNFWRTAAPKRPVFEVVHADQATA